MFEPIRAVDFLARETMLFAAVGLMIGGIDDLLVDLIFIVDRLCRDPAARPTLATLPPSPHPKRLAIFVGAWDESTVIGAMLANAVARLDHADYRIYVGLYPNDPATIAAATAVADRDGRIRLVVGPHDGPTTKADCLNTLWRAMRDDDAALACETTAVVIHDAEDFVHPAELRVFDSLIDGRAVVQIPVLPLVARGSPFVSGHYADEFAEAHAKTVIVRRVLGAGMPLAGTGCAIAVPMLAAIAQQRGVPFDAASLTEDYELGLRIAELGGRAILARVRDEENELVAVRAFFPARIDAAVRQKARWMTGIALAGWDRTGWSKPRAIGDHWMRMRDRRAPLAMLVLAVAYLALVCWAADAALRWWSGREPVEPGPGWLIAINMALLVWRLGSRMAFTGAAYGWRQALWAAPRLVVGNYVALLAARRALFRYLAMLQGAPLVWDKTRHVFPDDVTAGRA